ncbi:hypothetical protein AAC03nite_07220 [Alicyclobacillus acidoterrestris]|uniref:hypothetical protein n=1 Tax=Alicyclobacillus suci TaxID=2816080 RepID=UPI0011972E65|nr:hypothetical protein [Alicyclobacillus suci]GEO24937.1 hypothetical protein AAC03nite_07220 [Alicyclobacillus acidoterrestris]
MSEQESIQQLVRMVGQLIEINKVTQQELRDFRQDMNHRFEQIDDRIDGLSTKVRVISRKVGELSVEVDTLQESNKA